MAKRSDLHLRSAADVSSLPPADGQVIAWDTSVNQWVPSDVGDLVVIPDVDLTDIVIDDDTANAFRVREGANNYIHVNTSDAGSAISLGNANTNPRIETLGGGYFSIGSGVIEIPDATAGALVVVDESLRQYIAIHSDTGSYGPLIQFGDTSHNPDLMWTGSGAWYLGTSAGTSGQVLSTNGTGGAPSWLTLPTIPDAFDPEDVLISTSSATALRIHDGTGNWLLFNASTNAIVNGNATDNQAFTWLGTGAWTVSGSAGTSGQIFTSNGGAAAPSWQDAPDTFDPEDVLISTSSATALRIHDGTSNWLLFNASTNAIVSGNATDNPAFTWLGSGAWTVAGSAGTSGQIFTSNGGAAAPSWQDAPDTFDPEDVLISASSATALRIHDGTSNWLLFNADTNAISVGNAVDDPDVSILGDGAFIILNRFAVDTTYTYSPIPLLLGRGASLDPTQDGTILAESGSGADSPGGSLNYYAGAGTGDADPGEHRLYNSIRAASSSTAQSQRPNHILANDRRLLRTHGGASDTAVHRHQSTNEATFYAEHEQEWDAVEDPPLPPPTLVGTITFPSDFNGTLRGHLNFINHYVGYDDGLAEYDLALLSGAAILKAVITDGAPVLMGAGDLVIDSVTYRHLPYAAEELLGIDFTQTTTLLVRSTVAGTIDLYAIGGSGTVDESEITGNVLIDARWHALEIDSVAGGGGGTAPTITSFTVDITGAGAPAGSVSCRAAVQTLDFAWTATGDPTITYAINQGVGSGLSSPTTGVASVEGVTVYTLTATNSAGSDTATVTVTGVRQVISRYTWDWGHLGSDLANPWPTMVGTADGLDQKGTAATGGQSNAGLNPLALPAGLVNQAVLTSSGSTSGYGDSLTSGNGHPLSNTCFHVRLIVRPVTLSTSGLFAQWFFNGNNYFNLRTNNTDSTIFRFALFRAGAGLVNYESTAGTLANGSEALIDVIWDRDGGTGGQARVIVRVNGVEHVNLATAGAFNLTANAATTLFGLMGSRTGGAPLVGNYTGIMARNLSAYTDFTLADHQADATALGL